MASHVPEFGNWESEDVPYTMSFEKARKGKNVNAKMSKTTDLEENRAAIRSKSPIHHFSRITTEPASPSHTVQSRSIRNQEGRRKDAEEFKRSYESRTLNDYGSPRSPYHRNSDYRTSNEESYRKSPLHLHAAESLCGTASPYREKVEKDATIPEFGEWNKKSDSANDYSIIFNNASEQKRDGGRIKVPLSPIRATPQHNLPEDSRVEKVGCLCFSWSKK